MQLSLFQWEAHQTAVYPDEFRTDALTYVALGLAGEAGELANQVKKILRDDEGRLTAERADKLIDELGDVLWYVAEFATVLDVQLNDVAIRNLRKLHKRAEDGTVKGDKR